MAVDGCLSIAARDPRPASGVSISSVFRRAQRGGVVPLATVPVVNRV